LRKRTKVGGISLHNFKICIGVGGEIDINQWNRIENPETEVHNMPNWVLTTVQKQLDEGKNQSFEKW
jgi:hypothetical protein